MGNKCWNSGESSFNRAIYLAQARRSDSWPTIRRRELVDRMAKTFLEKRAIFVRCSNSIHLEGIFLEGAYRAKVKTPFEMIVSAVRATGANVDFTFALANQPHAARRASLSQTRTDGLFERSRSG